ncbi:MAG: hypothetical protein M3357_15645, partial [Actinomycetota bacterium]|nr:hypothetical protein [Actinomycetota bacterium]
VQTGGTADESPAPAPAGDLPAPGAPAAPSAPALVSPIAPGSPGSVGFGQTSAGNLVQKGGAAPRTPGTAPERDGPFSETLPYPKAEPPAVAEGKEDIGKVLVGLPAVIASDNRRELIIPLAAGLLVFVLAMHAFYLSRRTDKGPVEPDF